MIDPAAVPSPEEIRTIILSLLVAIQHIPLAAPLYAAGCLAHLLRLHAAMPFVYLGLALVAIPTLPVAAALYATGFLAHLLHQHEVMPWVYLGLMLAAVLFH